VDTVRTGHSIPEFFHRTFETVKAATKTRPPSATSRGQMRSRFLVILVSFLAFASLLASAQQHPTESQVKAAYLYNFGKFVSWQADQASRSVPLEICVLGKDPFGGVLDATVGGESIDGRTISVRRIAKIQDAPQCRILFVSSSEEGRLNSVLPAAQHFGMLTVSDIPRFATRGGVIEFVTQEGKIRFEVNRDSAEQSGLVLSSQLLKVASKVIEKTSRGGP
jgi:hypothetical protein